MRHIYVERASLLIALLLILVAALFAAWRSEGLVFVLLADEQRLEEVEAASPAPGEEPESEPGAVAWAWEDLGAEVYAGQCRTCHADLPHLPELVGREEGRTYLVDLMVFGFRGEARIEGDRVALDHVRFDDLSNEEIAAVLNHALTAWGNEAKLPDDVTLYTPDDVETARDRDLAPEDVAEERPED